LALATTFVLIFVIAPRAASGLPLSVSWIFGLSFAIPLALIMCLLSAVGGLGGSYGPGSGASGVAVGSLVGGGLGVALIAGVGTSVPAIVFFAIGAVVQRLILIFVYRSAASPPARRSSTL
jgi:hypothetical protein